MAKDGAPQRETGGRLEFFPPLPKCLTTGKFQKAATAANTVAQMVSKAGGGEGDSPTLGLARDIPEGSADGGKADEDRGPGSTPVKPDSEHDPSRTTTVAKDPLASSLFSMAALMRPSVSSSSSSGATKALDSSTSVASVTSSLSPSGLSLPSLLPPPPPGLSASALLANLNSSLQLGYVYDHASCLAVTQICLLHIYHDSDLSVHSAPTPSSLPRFPSPSAGVLFPYLLSGSRPHHHWPQGLKGKTCFVMSRLPNLK